LIVYFDSAYIAKCYLPETDGPEVRALARSASGLCSSALSIAELACVFHRQAREGRIPAESIAAIRQQFQEDLEQEVWSLVPVTDRLLRLVERLIRGLPPSCLLRAGDAIHLATAIDAGFREIWTNDRRLLEAAEAAGLRGRCVA
jgi:predicted nucleic acid-binding protein